MIITPTVASVVYEIDTQLKLAELSTTDESREMHEALERFYRAQLIAIVLDEELQRFNDDISLSVSLRTPQLFC